MKDRKIIKNAVQIIKPITPMIDDLNQQLIAIIRIRPDTNENANSQVYYGLTNVVEIGSVNEPNMKQVHSIELVGLQPGTQHYFQIRSADIVGNIGYSVVQTFTTTDTVGPVISDVAVENITGTTARVVWSTDENSTSLVNYV